MKQKTKNKLIGRFGSVFIKLLIGSLRLKIYDFKNLVEAKKQFGPVIYAFWHNRMLILSYAHKFEDANIIISRHTDGEYISFATNKLGYRSIRGSTTRGGIGALKKSLRALKKFDLAITPDGPKGPKETVKDGILYIAYKSAKPIIPVSCNSKRKWILNSWDNFIIPRPFSPAKIIYGKPIFINNKSEFESKKEELQNILIKLGNKIE